MSDAPEKPKSRTWFVILAWITMVLFTAFVAWITILSMRIPQLRDAAREPDRPSTYQGPDAEDR